MAKPQNQAAAGRILRNRPRTPEEVLPGEPSAAARRGAQAGVMADIPGGLVDLARGGLGYGAAGLESLLPPDVAEALGVSGFRRYMMPYTEEEKRQARQQYGAPPVGSSERIEEELVRSGALPPATGTREEFLARLLAGFADAAPGPVAAGTIAPKMVGKRMGSAAAEAAEAPVFYSPLLEAAATSQTQKASPEQWISTLKKQPGIKEAELEWTGVEDWLKSQKRPVTRQELEDYLQGTEIQVQEVVKGASSPYPYKTADEWQNAIFSAERTGNFDEADRLTALWEESRGFGPPETPNFAEYTYGTNETGGENYRELLLTIPAGKRGKPKLIGTVEEIENNRMWRYRGPGGMQDVFKTQQQALEEQLRVSERFDKRSDAERRGGYKSSHWDEPNIVAHVRFNDRTTPEGEKVLFLEEVQSDWAQEGRKKGFGDEDVPSGPFLQNTEQWTSLALKRMIRYAADQGYDRIAWTPGNVQAERYGLSGEGMEAFYDKIVPNAANKIGKKHGAKTEVTTVETSEGPLKALSIPMTEKLKAAAKQGLPYFAILPPVMASSFRPEEQQRDVAPKVMPARDILERRNSVQ